MDDEEIREESLTPDEAREAESGQMTGEEAHRYGEFRELRDLAEDMMRELRETHDDVRAIREGMGIMVESGAVINDAAEDAMQSDIDRVLAVADLDGDGDADIIDADLDDLDLDME